MRMLSGVLRSESPAVGSRPALSTSDSMACTEVLHRGGQAIARRGSEQRCGTFVQYGGCICAIWGLYRCALLTGRAYAHPCSTSMAAGILCVASCPTQHTIVSSRADKRGQAKAVAQRLSTSAYLLTRRGLIVQTLLGHWRSLVCAKQLPDFSSPFLPGSPLTHLLTYRFVSVLARALPYLLDIFPVLGILGFKSFVAAQCT